MLPVVNKPISASTGQTVDRLFELCLLGMVASGYCAVAGSGYLDLSTVLITAAALLVRFTKATGFLKLPFPPIAVTVATLAYIGFYPLDYLFLSKEFLAATVHLVFFLTITKLLTAETERDYTYLTVIAFLELLAASILNGHISFFVFLALFLLFAAGAFTSSEIRRSMRTDVRIVRGGLVGIRPRLIALTLSLSFGVLAMTGGLFFFLPRTARAAFQHLVPERYHLPGFSSEITLGQLGEIKRQATAVMHVRFLSATHPEGLKWRGMALSTFDGKRWYNDPLVHYTPIRTERSHYVRLVEDMQRPPVAHRFAYEVHLKDFGTDTLFFAGVPEFVSTSVPLIRRAPSGTIRLPPGTSASGVSYSAHAYVEAGDNRRWDQLGSIERAEYLNLPILDPRIHRLAHEMTAAAATPEARAAAIEQRLRSDYGYTLTLLSQEVPDPLAHFLFERKKGHCEYFASSMAVMLRVLKIPSRVVTGFQSGLYNPISGQQVIRTSDAHSWVEAYLPGRGWTTFDPTPPDPGGSAGGDLLTRVNLYFDAAETFWQDWIVNYDFDHQLVLATRVQESSRSTNWADSASTAVRAAFAGALEFLKKYGAQLGATVVLMVLTVLYGPAILTTWKALWRVRRVKSGNAQVSDATLLYNRMLKALVRRGIEKPAWLTPGEFANTLPTGDLGSAVTDFTRAYQAMRFGGRLDAAPRMLSLLESIEAERR